MGITIHVASDGCQRAVISSVKGQRCIENMLGVSSDAAIVGRYQKNRCCYKGEGQKPKKMFGLNLFQQGPD